MAYADIRIEAPEAFLTKDATANDYYRVALMYSEGSDVAIDLIASHKFFNPAATRGHRDANICRHELAAMMSQAAVL